MVKRNFGWWTLALALLGASSVSYASSILVNGDFGSGDLTGWDLGRFVQCL